MHTDEATGLCGSAGPLLVDGQCVDGGVTASCAGEGIETGLTGLGWNRV